jgi:hypothetical protein
MSDDIIKRLREIVYDLAALIPDPNNPQEQDWPCDNPADRACLQSAYVKASSILADADLIERMAQAEPVAWAATDESGTVVEALGMNQSRRFDTALYLAPPAREPLSAEQVFADDGIMAANARIGLPLSEIMEITRAVEQAHGIRSEK